MRIVYLVLGKDMAGGETVCLQIMRAARMRGHNVCILVPARGSVMETALSEGFEVHVLPIERTFHFHRALQLAQFLRHWHADLLHTHTMLPGMILARLGAKLAGVALVCHAHSPNVFSRQQLIKIFQHVLDHITLRFCSTIIAVSADTRQQLIEQGNPVSIEILPNGVSLGSQRDLSRLHIFQEKWHLQDARRIVGCVARLERNKGQHDLVAAAARIKRLPHSNNQSIRFMVVGNDPLPGRPYLQEIQTLASELGVIDIINFTGFQPHAADIVHAFDILVLPSYREAMPMSILEAMAAAKPVVATTVNGIPEVVVDGVTGFLVPSGDPNALAEAILKLLNDPALAHAMGQAGRARLEEHFNLEKIHIRLFDLYEQITDKRRG